MNHEAQTNAIIEKVISSTLIRGIINAGMTVTVMNITGTEQVKLCDHDEIMAALSFTNLNDLIIHNDKGEKQGFFMLYFGQSNGCDVIGGRSSTDAIYGMGQAALKLSYQLNVNYKALCAMRAANQKSMEATDPTCVIELIQCDHNGKISSLLDSTDELAAGDVINYGKGVTSVVVEVMNKVA